MKIGHICITYSLSAQLVAIIVTCFILQDPMSNFVTRQVVRSFSPDQTTESVSLPVNQDAFLPPGAIITLTVVRAEVTLPADIAGNLGDATAPAQLVIAESVANPIIFFDQRSLIASVNDCKFGTVCYFRQLNTHTHTHTHTLIITDKK